MPILSQASTTNGIQSRPHKIKISDHHQVKKKNIKLTHPTILRQCKAHEKLSQQEWWLKLEGKINNTINNTTKGEPTHVKLTNINKLMP